jgi:hypothetical protein
VKGTRNHAGQQSAVQDDRNGDQGTVRRERAQRTQPVTDRTVVRRLRTAWIDEIGKGKSGEIENAEPE